MIWLSGDFNIPNMNWQTMANPFDSPFSLDQQLLIDITQDYNMSQIVPQPTHLSNILDLFFPNNCFPTLIQNIQIIPGIATKTLLQSSQKFQLYDKIDWL